MTSQQARGWIRPLGDVPDRVASVVCCPHAGGTADYFGQWSRWVPPGVQVAAVQYPGHGDRLAEPCLTDVHELSTKLATETERLRPGELILFGHSFGAAVAFEVAVRLTERGMPPRAVVLSARVAPHLEPGGARPPRSDTAIWEEMSRLGGTPAEIATDPEWREMLTPQLRADFLASDTYRPSRTLLPCPITVTVGGDDPDVPRASIDAWRGYTGSEFAVRVFPGGHFYLADHAAGLAAEVARFAAPGRSSSRPGSAVFHD